MFKGKFVFLTLIAAALLCWQIMPASVNTANSGIVDPCSSTAVGAGCCYMVCPQGDGTRLDDIPECNAIISLVARDNLGIPLVGILAQDIWLDGCTDLCLCGGSGNIDADSNTAVVPPGFTTISGDMQAGGCDLLGLVVVVQGVIINCPAPCLPYWVTSPDINCDFIVDIIDLALFAAVYVNQPGGYDACYDFNCDGLINIVDFAIFSIHYTHSC